MTEDGIIRLCNVPYGFEGRKEVGKSAVDLLLVESMIEYEDLLKDAFEERGFHVGNVSRIYANLDPEGKIPSGENTPGSNIYRIDSGFVSGEFTFSDEPNPLNIWVIASKKLKYGRQFNQICQVLERSKKRNLNPGATPPTFAFFKEVCNQEFGYKIVENHLFRIEKTISGYVPETLLKEMERMPWRY